jgi:hypothetical protein
MLELLTGLGLASAAGLNAYIPMLILGLAGHFLDFVKLPVGWEWLTNEWVLLILAVLLLIEVIADKIPVVDTINDWLQTIVRPAAGGILFSSGTGSQTLLVHDPAAFFQSNQWVPIVLGIVIALAIHLAKASVRPVANTLTAGLAAPVISTVEDVSSVALSVAAILLPVLTIVILGLVVWGFVRLFTRRRRRVPAESTPTV